MRTYLLFLLLVPCQLWAQADTLKPIGLEQIPGYGRYGSTVHIAYTYDGIDVRRTKDLSPYIMASGDADAIREFNAYISKRHAGGWLITGGATSALIGIIIMGSNGPGADGKFTTQQPIICPSGSACGSAATGGGLVYGGQVVGYQNVTDTDRQNTFAMGSVMTLGGALLIGLGWGLCLPGQHVRHAVQYYNRSLKQRGISWQVQPYSAYSNQGVSLVGKF